MNNRHKRIAAIISMAFVLTSMAGMAIPAHAADDADPSSTAPVTVSDTDTADKEEAASTPDDTGEKSDAETGGETSKSESEDQEAVPTTGATDGETTGSEIPLASKILDVYDESQYGNLVKSRTITTNEVYISKSFDIELQDPEKPDDPEAKIKRTVRVDNAPVGYFRWVINVYENRGVVATLYWEVDAESMNRNLTADKDYYPGADPIYVKDLVTEDDIRQIISGSNVELGELFFSPSDFEPHARWCETKDLADAGVLIGGTATGRNHKLDDGEISGSFEIEYAGDQVDGAVNMFYNMFNAWKTSGKIAKHDLVKIALTPRNDEIYRTSCITLVDYRHDGANIVSVDQNLDVEALKAELAAAKAELAELKKSYESLFGDYEGLKSKYDINNTELVQLRNTMQSKDKEIADLKAKIADLNAQISNLQNNVRSTNTGNADTGNNGYSGSGNSGSGGSGGGISSGNSGGSNVRSTGGSASGNASTGGNSNAPTTGDPGVGVPLALMATAAGAAVITGKRRREN